MFKKHIALATLAVLLSTSAFSEESTQSDIWDKAGQSLTETWASTDYELYVPINTWHNRSYYSARKIDEFNEQPWGWG